MEYFDTVISNLMKDDISILEILIRNKATERQNSIMNMTLHSESKLSISHYRNAIQRLQAACLVNTISIKKDNLIQLTQYGKLAIERLKERGSESA